MKPVPFFESAKAWWFGLVLALLAPFAAFNDYF